MHKHLGVYLVTKYTHKIMFTPKNIYNPYTLVNPNI